MKLVALWRGVNVSGQKQISMTDLKIMFEQLGFENVSTYIQSGNVVFSTKKKDVKKEIEAAIKKKFKYDVTVIIRTPQELKKIITNNPFPKAEPNKLHVLFLETKPTTIPKDLDNYKQNEAYKIIGKEIYLHCPDGYGKSKLNNNFFEKKLHVKATTRNWNTVKKLYELHFFPGI